MEQLIQEFVDSGSHLTPQRAEEVQREIQRLQREPTGWHSGLALLKKSNRNFRFYGALTLTVKIRTDWAFLESQKGLRDAVLADLVASYVEFTNESEQQFVLRKICSTLAAFFLHPSSCWHFPVRYVLLSLCGNQIAESEGLEDIYKAWSRIQHVNPMRLRSVLWLCSSLAEEVAKSDVKGDESIVMTEKVVENAPDVWYLVYLILRCLHVRNGDLDAQMPLVPNYLSSSPEREVLELSKEALETASLWMGLQASSPSVDGFINDVADAAMALILRSFFILEIADNAILCLTGVVQQAPKHFAKAGRESLNALLTSQQAESYVLQLVQGSFEAEAVHFVTFIVSLLDLYDLSSPEAFHDETLVIVLAILRKLLYTPGTAVVVDEVCQTVLEAFNQIADRWSDWVGSNAADQSLKPLLQEACIQYAAKIQYPPEESESASHHWEAEERAQFQDFRNDVQDLLHASYACVGPELIENLAAALQSCDITSGWEAFEAHLYCLGALSDIVSHHIAELGQHISGVFALQKWNILMYNITTAPDLARQGAINFISRNTFILQRDQQHLLPCVNFLFGSVHVPGSTNSASRAIFALCQRQRSVLVEALPQFINSISILAGIPSEDRHRIFGAVAAIIQALSTEEGKVGPLSQIFVLMSQTAEAAARGSTEAGLISAVDLLQTLASVGKGLRAPPIEVIDLESEPSINEQNFWISGNGKYVQQNVQNVIDEILVKYPREPALLEATCDILRSGYTEAHPSPFKFDAGYSAAFLSRNIRCDSPRIGVIIETASSFLASHASNPDAIRQEFLQVSSAVTWSQRKLLESFAATNRYDDHEFTYSSLDYFTRMLPKYGYYFGDESLSEAWQVLFEFALLALENADTLPRRSSAQFWACIFDSTPSLSADSSRNIVECIRHYGARFVTTLLHLLGGGAARSELDVLCEPLKKLLARQGLLGSRLLRESAAGADARTERFVSQVIGLRGGRRTGELAREFWVGSRGVAFAYAG